MSARARIYCAWTDDLGVFCVDELDVTEGQASTLARDYPETIYFTVDLPRNIVVEEYGRRRLVNVQTVLDHVRAAAKAADGDSNDAEILALQEALSVALDALGLDSERLD